MIKVPPLPQFVKKYLPSELKMNWHHKLIYDVLYGFTVQNRETGKLEFNPHIRQRKSGYYYLPTRYWLYNKQILIMIPRFHAKTRCAAINFPIWLMARDPDVRILIVGKSLEISGATVRTIKWELEKNEKLLKDFPHLRPPEEAGRRGRSKKWTETSFIVQRESRERDPTVAAVGAGGSVISRRADVIIVDDLLDLENARTPAQRAKIKEWFENVLYPVLSEKGILVVLGTPWYRGDLYDEILSGDELGEDFDVRLKLKALFYSESEKRRYGTGGVNPLKEPNSLRIEDILPKQMRDYYGIHRALARGKGALWPDKWSIKALEKKRKTITAAAFSRQYLCEPIAEEARVFREKDLEFAVTRGRGLTLLKSYDKQNWAFKNLITAIGVDLAISQKSTADNSAIAVWGLSSRRDRVLLNLEFGKWTMSELKERVIENYYNFDPIKVCVENVAFQDMMVQELEDEDIPVEGVRTIAGKKYSEEAGISHIASLFEQKRVVVPSKKTDERTVKAVKQFLHECSTYQFNTKHTGDCLMASWFALSALREFDKFSRESGGYFPTEQVVKLLRGTVEPRRYFITGINPPILKQALKGTVNIYIPPHRDFVDKEKKYLIVATKPEKKLIGYVFETEGKEIIAKLEARLTAMFSATILERCGYFWNQALIVVDKEGEGEAILNELLNRNYPNLVFPLYESGKYTIEPGFTSDASNIPLYMESLKFAVTQGHLTIPDGQAIKELGEILDVVGGEIITSHGDAQRARTLAIGWYILDTGWQTETNKSGQKKTKNYKIPYRVFNY